MTELCDNYWMNQLDDGIDYDLIGEYEGECIDCEYYERCKQNGDTLE